jgi:hypothetical protein
MTTRSRAAALVAGLAIAALAGPVLAGPGQGYAPNNGYAANNGYSYEVAAPAGGISSAPVSGCATCNTPAAASQHPGFKVKCPPPYYHVYEGPPCLKFKKGCPRPVCDPCELPHFGYYQSCWTPWPYPPDWRHCPYPTPSDMLPPPPYPPFTPKLNQERPTDLQRAPKDARQDEKKGGGEGPMVPPMKDPGPGPEKLPQPQTEPGATRMPIQPSQPVLRVMPE